MTDDNGLYYMRARYYSPDLKRFINSDPVQGNIYDSRTLNKYAYANGNPISYVDPFGTRADIVLTRTREARDTLVDNLLITRNWLNSNSVLENLLLFYTTVKHKGQWDYKINNPEWMPTNEEFSVLGVTMTIQDFGNLNYGITGASLGYSPLILYGGAGYAQIRSGNIDENCTVFTFFDDSQDAAWITMGILAYAKFDTSYYDKMGCYRLSFAALELNEAVNIFSKSLLKGESYAR